MESLLRVRSGGVKVDLDVSKEKVDKMRKKVGLLAHGDILDKIKMKYSDFELYFMLYILGAFLCPTGSGIVSESLLKLMASTDKKWERYDWATYVLEDLSSNVLKFQ